jgi:transglutaminase-like putative cysteine protease
MVAGGFSGRAAGPILVTAVAGGIVPALALRRRVPAPLVAVTLGAVTVALVAVWTSVPGATRDGLPTATTLRVLRVDLRAARANLSSFGLPLHASPGVVVLGALLAGMGAVAARMTLGIPSRGIPPERTRHLPAFALVPSTTFVAWSCVAEPSADSALLVATLLAAGAATVALTEPTATEEAVRTSGRHRARQARGRRLRPAAAVSAVAIAVAVIVGVTTGSPRSGASSGSPGTAIATADAPTGLLLASDVTGVERRDPSVVLFWARSPLPTYWQVGVLTEWRGGRWLPDQATLDDLGGRGTSAGATVGLPPPSNHTFAVSVTVGYLSSRLLPVPPTTDNVDVPGGGLVNAQGAVAATPSALDERYAATAVVPPSVSASTPSSTTGLSPDQLAPYLSLPPVSPVVTELARQATSSATTPLAQAESLVDWLRSGSFRYTLTPPPPPSSSTSSSSTGADPLVTFLTETRAGTCEAFAGAFAVMARSLGLPTRIAVGFTEGHSSHGVSTVRGADAHEWPEVYLGAALGWVSFEPTPQLPSGELSPPSVVGPTGISLPATSPPTAVTVSPAITIVPTSAPSTATVPPANGGSATSPTTAASSPAPWAWWVVAAVVIAVVVVAVVSIVERRRRRHRVRRATAPQRVLWAYQRAERELRRSGGARPAWRAPPAHARALLRAARDALEGTGSSPSSVPGDELLAALRDLVVLAELLERASYSEIQPTPDQVVQAEDIGTRVQRTLRRRSVRSLAKRVVVDGLRRQPALQN